jgi:hypothetical protein
MIITKTIEYCKNEDEDFNAPPEKRGFLPPTPPPERSIAANNTFAVSEQTT